MKRILCGRTPLHLAATFGLLALVACADDPAGRLPGPQLAQGGGNQCDLRTAVNAARSYFPGNGNGSIKDQALDIIDAMDAACEATPPNTADYTDGFFGVSALIQESLETEQAGDPADGNTLLRFLIGLQSPQSTPMFQPCAGGSAPASACETYDGFSSGAPVPTFTGPLSEGGAFAVVNTDASNSGDQAVCEGHEFDCGPVDPTESRWGAEPEVSWDDALYGTPSLITGEPIAYASDEFAYVSGGAAAYRWNVIPHVDPFQSTVEVGLCSDEDPQNEALLQKDGTVLEEATLDFCDETKFTRHEAPTSVFDRFAAFVGDLFDPRPRALVAIAFRLGGPGGGSGSWSDFFPIDIVPNSTFEITNPPVDGFEGVPLLDEDEMPPAVKAITTSEGTPIERMEVRVTFEKNGGFSSTEEYPESDDASVLTCVQGVCRGTTQADQDDSPGVLKIPVTFYKTGAYRVCVEQYVEVGDDPTFTSDRVCSGPFNIRPAP